MIKLSGELADALKDSDTIKVLTTTDQEGLPHSVCKQTLTVLDDGRLAYVELIERSETYKNMLRHHWDKRNVAIFIFNPKTGLSYQIKGVPTHCMVEGPIWSMLRDQCWRIMPETEPAAVWVISPDETRDQSYPVRVEAEGKRMLQYNIWNTYPGKKQN